jgi:hypothetical protein
VRDRNRSDSNLGIRALLELFQANVQNLEICEICEPNKAVTPDAPAATQGETSRRQRAQAAVARQGLRPVGCADVDKVDDHASLDSHARCGVPPRCLRESVR